MDKHDEIELITTKELCALFKKHRSTISRWTKAGYLPEPIRINNRIRGWTKESLKSVLKDYATGEGS